MIGQLPISLNVNGVERKIRSDFRVALLIFSAFSDPDLLEEDKTMTMLECLYEVRLDISDYEDAINKAIWFLDGGRTYEKIKESKKLIDWEQDESLIFSSVNKVAGKEVREQEYVHWWTFLGYFNEVGEGLLNCVINIRSKKNKHKRLEKYEEDFYLENMELVDIKSKYSTEEQEEINRLNELLNS